jgi:glycosyltransferase involved in cell wall biosynthesis
MNRKQRRAAEKTRQRAAGPLKPGENVAIRAAIDAQHGRITEVNADGKTIGLCMIVKNEAHVILRCLESVRPLVDYVLIEDTGSTDGTQAIIREWLDRVGLPGEVYDEPWRDFAYNRSHVLAKLRQNQNVDYALIVDADDHITFDADFDIATFKKSLSQDMYDVELRGGPARYLRPQICSNRLKFQYRGVLHEFLESPRGRISRGKATGFYTTSTREGARSQDPEKYRKDAALLEKALRTERDQFLRSRYTFYLARSYENAGDKELALKAFLKRATLGYWTEEIFMSLYSAGHLQEALGRPVEEVIATFMRASKAAPTRAEALHAASRVCRENKRFEEGYEYARRGLEIPLPANGLFVVSWIYGYGLLDEFAVNAYWAERYQDGLDACQRLLREGKMPSDMHDRVKKNADFARDKLAERVKTLPDEVPTVSETSRASESEPKRPRLKVILICGPWGSGTSVVAGLLDRMGAFGLGPYFETHDPKTANSYESVPFREIIRNALGYPSQPGLSFTPPVPGAVQSGLRSLQTRIEQQEFEPYDYHFSKPIFLKYPLSAFVIPQICEVFDTKLIYVMRPLEDIEQTRLRRNWEPYYGAEGAALIYNEMSAALKHHPYPTMTIDYKDLLASPTVNASNIARFVGLDLSPAELQQAIDFVRKPDAMPLAFDEMRRDDRSQTAPGGEPEELFVGLYNAAKQLPKMGRPFDEVIAAYERASNAAPNRAEALHAASRFCRENKRFEEGYEYARRGLEIPPPGDGLSIQQWIYDYGLLDELAINAYWTERYAECVDACDRLLSEGKLPREMRDRVLNNKNFAVSKQQEMAASSSPEFGPFLKLLRAAREKEKIARPTDEIIAAYVEAAAACPTRAEALHGAARYCRNKSLHERGYEFAAQGLAIPYPHKAPAVEDWIYEYGLLDEFAVNAYWTVRYQDCLNACQRLLREGKMPARMHDRVKKNAEFAADKLRPKQILRIIASMTTIPSRIGSIRPVIEAVLAQTAPIEHIELNIPYRCIRTGEPYIVPAWLESMDRVMIFRTEDYGPITKVAPTFLRHQNDHETSIWSVDDDFAYPANQLELLCRVHRPDKRRILTRYGGKLGSDGTVQFWFGEAEVTMFEGFGGVLYPPACIGGDFLEYLTVTSANDDCRKNDDIVLAMYFNSHGLPIYLYNRPSEDAPYMVPGKLAHSEQDALKQTGHSDNYKRIFAFVKALQQSNASRGAEEINLKPMEQLSSGAPPRVTSNNDTDRHKGSSGGQVSQLVLLDFLSNFTPRRAVGRNKIRVGNKAGDGGYVMLDDFSGIVGAISAGIGSDVSWDMEIADRGIDVFQFDHTVTGSPVAHDRFHFFRHRISPQDTNDSESIQTVIGRLPDEGQLILKIDIEGAEWDVLDVATVDDLGRVAQFVGEFHGFSNVIKNDWRERVTRVMTKLNSVFQIVHVHGNNWSPFNMVANVPFPDVIELTLVNRSLYQFEDTDEIYPTSIDRPNHEHRPDIFLGSMRFK